MSHNPRVINYQTNISKTTTQNNQPNTYDKNSNLLQRVVPTPANHDFTYNGTDKKTSYRSPLNKATIYTYDKNKRVTAIKRPSEATITNIYDKGRLVATTMPEGRVDYSYLFANKVGAITSGSESFEYSFPRDTLS